MYIIPANTKKSMLILGFFTPIDLIIFATGATITLALLIALKSSALGEMIFVLMPLLISGFLVMPVPNYHNMRQLATNFIKFFTGRRKYVWKGWCWHDDDAIIK